MRDPFATSDAAYVLGALEDTERRAFEAHLATCDSCTRAVARLRGMPALLAAAPADAFEAADPPDTLLPRLMFAVRRERRRRIARAVLGAAAALLVAAGGVGAYAAATSHSSPRGVAMTKLDAAAPIDGRARVVDSGGGALVQIWCSYSATAYLSGQYQLVIRSRDGQPPQTLSSWAGVPGRTIVISAPTTWPRSDVAAVEIRYGSETVLTLAE